MPATNPTRRVMPTLVQTAEGWPAGDEGWTTQARIRATSASEGCGQVIGEAQLEQDTGRVVQPNGTQLEQVARAPLLNPSAGYKSLAGRWVRILLAASGGSVRVGDQTYNPLWHGVIDRPIYDPDGAVIAGGSMRWGCLGLADALNRIYLWRGYEWHADQLVDPGACPVFNDLPGGDRSAAKHDVNGVQAYTFERGAAAGTRVPWRARDVIEHVLAGFSRGNLPGIDTAPAGPQWVLGTGASLLEWEAGRYDFAGRTVAEVLNTLAAPSHGLTWRLKVVGATVQIIVTSTNRTAVTIGSVTIPAADPVVDDLTGDLWLESPGIQEETDYYDWITVHGAPPWVAVTLWWSAGSGISSLMPDGWSETSIPGTEPANEKNWRRWKLNPVWIGDQYPGPSGLVGVGLRHTRPYSASGADGSRFFGGYTPPPSALEITRLLPYAQGFATTKDGPRQGPLVVIGKEDDWQDFSEYIDVSPTADPAGLLLGCNVDTARFLKARLGDGTRTLLVTIGVREWAPYAVAWRRQGELPRDLPRTLIRRMPDCEQWVGLRGTVQGVAPGGTLTIAAADDMIRNDANEAHALLARLVARYGGAGASYSYGVDGLIDTAEGSAPGTFVSDVQVGAATIPANAVMTRRSWDFRFESYGTTYRFERLPLDAQSRP